MPLNVELCLKVKAAMLAEPDRLVMGTTLLEKTLGRNYYLGDDNERHNFPPCGTVGCFAGWAVRLSGIPYDPELIIGPARELLGLRTIELFYVGTWPKFLFDRYLRLGITQKEKGIVFGEMIDYLIEHKEGYET